MKRIALLFASLLSLACAATAPMPGRELVVRGGTLLAGTDLQKIDRGAVVIRDGKITWIGASADLPPLSEGAVILDAEGATILPGLVDSHAHIAGLGAALDTVDLVGSTSYDEVIDRIRRDAAGKPAGEWVLGRGWDQNDWSVKEFPTAAALDRAVGDRPVWVRRIDGHAGLASSAALRAARITVATPDPAGGKILRDPAGEPTGVFIDAAMDLVDSIVPPPSRTVRRERIRDAARDIASKGLTAVHDAGVDQDTITLMRELIDAGELPIRVYAMLTDDDELLDYWFERGPLVDYGGRLTIRSVKLYADGALGSRGAALLAPYADDRSNRGLMTSTTEHMTERARRALAAGFQVGTHAIGDAGVRNVLDSYETAGVRPESRFRIEHLQVVAPEDFARVARLGVISAMQPTHATSDMPWAEDRLGEARARGAYAWRTVLDAGGRLTLGSDFPVEEVDPLLGLYAAVTRQDLDGKPEGGWFPLQKLTIAEAIRGFTLDTAYASFEEDRRGSIDVGKFADLTIVKPDPTSSPAGEIPKTEILYTIVNGEVVYQNE